MGINCCYDYLNFILILLFLEIKRCIFLEYIELYIGVYKNVGIDKKKIIYKKMLKLLEMLKIFGMNGVNNIWKFLW